MLTNASENFLKVLKSKVIRRKMQPLSLTNDSGLKKFSRKQQNYRIPLDSTQNATFKLNLNEVLLTSSRNAAITCTSTSNVRNLSGLEREREKERERERERERSKERQRKREREREREKEREREREREREVSLE